MIRASAETMMVASCQIGSGDVVMAVACLQLTGRMGWLVDWVRHYRM